MVDWRNDQLGDECSFIMGDRKDLFRKQAQQKAKTWRLVLAGFFGGATSFIFVTAGRLDCWAKKNSSFIGTGIVMNAIAFTQLRKRQWIIELIKTTGLFFVLAIMTVGITSLVYYLYQFYFHRVLRGWEIVLSTSSLYWS